MLEKKMEVSQKFKISLKSSFLKANYHRTTMLKFWKTDLGSSQSFLNLFDPQAKNQKIQYKQVAFFLLFIAFVIALTINR